MHPSPYPCSIAWWQSDPLEPLNIDNWQLTKTRLGGDSDIFALRQPDCRRRSAPSYLVKTGPDAVAEHVYATLARRYSLPAQRTRWLLSGVDNDPIMAVAFPYLRNAFRPPSIIWNHDNTLGYEDRRANRQFVLNPADYFPMRALAALLNDCDGIEYFVCDHLLVAYDAAAGLTLSHLVHAPSEQPWAISALEVITRHDPCAGQAFSTALQQICADQEVPETIRGALDQAHHPHVVQMAPLLGRRVQLEQQRILAALYLAAPPTAALLTQVAADCAAARAIFERAYLLRHPDQGADAGKSNGVHLLAAKPARQTAYRGRSGAPARSRRPATSRSADSPP